MSIDEQFKIPDSRKNWINSTHHLKSYFLEKIVQIFELPFQMEDVKVDTKIYQDEEMIPSTIYYDGDITLTPILIGGYPFEYIYEADVESENALFTKTEDLDLQVKIPDFISDEYQIVNVNKLIEGQFYQEILDQIETRISNLGFSDLSLEFPPVEGLNIDNVNLVIDDTNVQDDICFKRVYFKIMVDGHYHHIVDMMISFELMQNKIDDDIFEKTCYDGVARNFVIMNRLKLLHSSFETIYSMIVSNRYNHKMKNHIGRVIHLLNYISKLKDKDEKYGACVTCEQFIIKLQKKLKISSVKQLSLMVITEFKGEDLTLRSLISPISDYAISRHLSRFIDMFE